MRVLFWEIKYIGRFYHPLINWKLRKITKQILKSGVKYPKIESVKELQKYGLNLSESFRFVKKVIK